MTGLRGTVRVAVLSLAVAATFAGFHDLALAQDAMLDAAAGDAQAPVRAVRLSFIEGVVTVDSPGDIGSQQAQTNLPLVAGVSVSTGADGQAEIEFEDGSILRLTPNSILTFDTLSVDSAGVFNTRVSLLKGLAYAELRSAQQYHYTVNVGGDILSPVENTTVRISYDEPPAEFAVLDGTVEVRRQGTSLRQQGRAGESLRADPNNAGLYLINDTITEDTWDAWNADRDQASVPEASNRTGVRDSYAGSQGYGWSDLDANGTWYDVPGQGQVWQPEVAVTDVGFDPYANGAWLWYPATGYVWASAYSWGWTPYRCGTWNYYGGFGWGWNPANACGGFGWGFWGAGRPVNIIYTPGGYKVPHVPHPHPGPIHPILPTKLQAGNNTALEGQMGWALKHGPRQINGMTATPVTALAGGGSHGATSASSASVSTAAAQGEHGTVVHGTSPARSALDRDFPVDRASHTAIAGRVSTQPPAVHTESGWQHGNAATGTSTAPQYTGQSGAAIFRNPPQSSQATGQRPTYTPPAQRPANTLTSPAGQHSTYMPPPMAHPSYTPPPRPTYTPPHYTPPPPPPVHVAPPPPPPHVAPK